MGLGIILKIKELMKYYNDLKQQKNIVPVYITKQPSTLLDGKIALITGGSGDIGFAIAKSFIEAGCKVILSGANEKHLQDTVELLGRNVAKYIVIDAREVRLFPDKVLTASQMYSEKKVDILVNCAGYHGNERFGEVNEGTYDKVLDINLKGLFFMTQAVGNYMKANKIKGHILNVSSAAALKPAWTPYEVSKWGVKGFTLGAADELIPYGIVVNAIAPGPVATKMLERSEKDTLYTDCVPTQRYATPTEIGELAVVMVSDMCNLVIGDTFYITGGSGTIMFR